MQQELNIALIAGPAYDSLYSCLPVFTAGTGVQVNIGFSGDHPTLNRHLAELTDVPYDLVSTHTKYAPSQMSFLAPVDDVIDARVLDDFAPLVLQLATIGGRLYGIPRNIDVRLLHYRTDLISTPPATWDELLQNARAVNDAPRLFGFIFPGRESGLFGTFFELAEMAGAELFPGDLIPDIENEAGRWALSFLRSCYEEKLAPSELPEWHYDKVHECFKAGRVAMVGDWPGYYSLYCDTETSPVHDRFGLSIYPVGPAGKSLAYGGGHTFALTKTGVYKKEAVELLLYLTAAEQQLVEAKQGCVPVRTSVMETMKAHADQTNGQRLMMLADVISDHILIPPKFARYPEVEEVLWRTVQRAYLGQLEVDAALESMTQQITGIVQSEVADKRHGAMR